MFTEKNSSYYQSQLADIKEDVIIRIMKLMRAKRHTVIKDPKETLVSYKIVDEPHGGKTLAKFIGSHQMSNVRNGLFIEELLDILETIENAEETTVELNVVAGAPNSFEYLYV